MNDESGNRAGQIRALNPSTDLRAIADLVELCFKDTIDDDGLDYIRYLRKLASDNSSIYLGVGRPQHTFAPIQGFVYEVDGRIVGNLSMIPFHKNGDFVYLIANVAVHPEFRRRRIAFDLTARSLKYAREKSAKSTWLQVRDDNPPAIDLYKQMGFVERCRRSTYTIKSRKRLPAFKGLNLKIGKRKNLEWDRQKYLMQEIYPEEIRWNVGLKEKRFLPGTWNGLSRFFSGISISHISIYEGNKLLGFASLERTTLFADNLWIVAEENHEEDVIYAAVPHFRSSTIDIRPQTINYPVDRAENAFISLGFEKNHTLIWMEETISPTGFLS
ncbi:MAG: GNAT family N-acetyltransferase [Anaerolineaceae bacterium]|nr:GNAT family N-acetyltransferase [Anaerolineaceae bacterium]